MADTVDFRALMATVSNNGDSNLDEVEEELQQLEGQKAELQEQLDRVNDRMQELQGERAKVVRRAVSAAKELQIEVPEEYRQLTTGGGGNRSTGQYEWSADGIKTKRQTVSRAMWRLSKGSGGSAGTEGQGVLRAGEFWGLVREQHGVAEEDLTAGDELQVELPNGREVTVTKVQ